MGFLAASNMKKWTQEEINKAFENVIKNQGFCYFKDHNLIKLDGRFASDELREIARVMDDIYWGNCFIERVWFYREKGEDF
jgi:hypothetical protein